jgi:hypothetical protein
MHPTKQHFLKHPRGRRNNLPEFPDCCPWMKRMKELSKIADKQNDTHALLFAQEQMEKHHR